MITSEHVEIHLSLWKSNPTASTAATETTTTTTTTTSTETQSPPPVCTIIEAQRRKGDAVTYYQYCRYLLSAADGSFRESDYIHSENEKQSHDKKIVSLANNEENDRQPKSTSTSMSSSSQEDQEEPQQEGEDALLALEIAASLLKKDRMDARQLGMETLCLLTDPIKSGIDTALLASKVVLFGSVDAKQVGESSLLVGEDDFMPAEELGIREAVLSLVQFGKLSEYIDFEAAEEEENERSGRGLAAEDHDVTSEEFNALLHNLALAVLANSLEVLGQHGDEMARIGGNKSGGVSINNNVAAVSTQNIEAPTNANAFLEETKEISKKELLSTLLNVLGKAESKPHDACLSAQCLRSLFQASKKAKRKARDLNAKQIVNTALDVGSRTHVKLETETRNVIRELEKTDDAAEDDNENNNNQNQQMDDSDASDDEY